MTSLEYYIEQIEQFISALTDDIESGEGTVVTQTKLAVYQEVLEHLEEIEQEPCEDAISRQAVIDALTKTSGIRGDALKALYDLPPVNPQPKTGHWIPVSEKLPDKEGYHLCSVRYMYPPYNFFEPEKVKYMDDVTIQKFDGEFNIEVKAWMPLPEPFESQESERI